MALTTLADVRELVEKHLPTEHRARHTERYVGTLLAAARGVDNAADIAANIVKLPKLVQRPLPTGMTSLRINC